MRVSVPVEAGAGGSSLSLSTSSPGRTPPSLSDDESEQRLSCLHSPLLQCTLVVRVEKRGERARQGCQRPPPARPVDDLSGPASRFSSKLSFDLLSFLSFLLSLLAFLFPSSPFSPLFSSPFLSSPSPLLSFLLHLPFLFPHTSPLRPRTKLSTMPTFNKYNLDKQSVEVPGTRTTGATGRSHSLLSTPTPTPLPPVHTTSNPGGLLQKTLRSIDFIAPQL